MSRKILEVEIEGRKRGFRFNMLAIGNACRLDGCDMNEFLTRLTSLKDDSGNVVRYPDMTSMVNFFYASAVNYTEGKGEQVDYTPQDVSDWLEVVGLVDAMKMITEAMKMPLEKNRNAPATGQ